MYRNHNCKIASGKNVSTKIKVDENFSIICPFFYYLISFAQYDEWCFIFCHFDTKKFAKVSFCPNLTFFISGIPPEGCSSVHFERIMGKKNAERMLGKEGWTPTAKEAKEAGFVMEVVAHDQLMTRAQQIAEQWVKEGKVRSMIEQGRVMLQRLVVS